MTCGDVSQRYPTSLPWRGLPNQRESLEDVLQVVFRIHAENEGKNL
jgi:hypothetical protein